MAIFGFEVTALITKITLKTLFLSNVKRELKLFSLAVINLIKLFFSDSLDFFTVINSQLCKMSTERSNKVYDLFEQRDYLAIIYAMSYRKMTFRARPELRFLKGEWFQT